MLDQEIQGFIEKTDAFYPADAVNHSIPEQRRWYDALCREFATPRPKRVSAQDEILSLPGRQIGLRRYRREDPNDCAVILFLHGGGFVLGGLESHDDHCNEICDRTGLDIVAVDYRLSPEFTHPAAFDDALAAFDHVVALGKPIILVGDSAGGTLCASVAQARKAHTGTALFGQVLIYPSLGSDLETGSMISQSEAPGLSTADVAYYFKMRAGGEPPLEDPTFCPMAAEDFSGVPPTIMMAAEVDPLCDDCVLYAGRLAEAGVPVHAQVDQGLIHGHLRARRMSAKAAKSFDDICHGIEILAAGDSLEALKKR
ncbi:alpha/beta hydrolase [Aestuariispira insulae]|uniref:Acetyl esterase n=1 Tax=Aestuariispira insulae TaxID=1461337 RepID=A0A3D9HZP5_9PROT|nr:alpha/beta hydrolase [Aestuariispira insulae]RED54376.1 acetyl esterase [Aestuariispira insulae]